MLLVVFAIAILELLFSAWLAAITPEGQDLWS